LEISDVESPNPGGTGCKSRVIHLLPRRLALAFPMTGLALIVVLALDLLVLSRVPALKFMFK
jgi:uncharacterized iron-regulated membrane protein